MVKWITSCLWSSLKRVRVPSVTPEQSNGHRELMDLYGAIGYVAVDGRETLPAIVERARRRKEETARINYDREMRAYRDGKLAGPPLFEKPIEGVRSGRERLGE